MIAVANARMYSVTPEAAAAWAELFAWLAGASGVALEYIAHAPPSPMAELWERDDIACVFMCGRPWHRARPRPVPLAAPVPALSHYRGRPQYATNLAVRADSSFQSLPDTFGGKLGFTIEESQSGFNALRHHLLSFRSEARPRLYASSIGPLYTPRAVVDALLSGRIDVGPIDSYAFDLMRQSSADPVHQLRVVAVTEFAPIPFLVAAPATPPQISDRLIRSLLESSGDRQARAILDRLLLKCFVPVDTASYEVLGEWDREAMSAGYAIPA